MIVSFIQTAEVTEIMIVSFIQIPLKMSPENANLNKIKLKTLINYNFKSKYILYIY